MKKYLSLILFFLFIGIGLSAVIPRSFSTYELYQKRWVVTSDGTSGGSLVADLNSGGKVIIANLFDLSGNAYVAGTLTGESDPVWTFDKPSYATIDYVSTNYYNSGYIGSNYATKAYVTGLGYITGFNESDPNRAATSQKYVNYTSGEIYVSGTNYKYTPATGTFADAARWATNPTSGQIIEKFFGTGSAYKEKRSSGACAGVVFNYVEATGTGTLIATNFAANTVYVLYSGYNFGGTSKNQQGACTAIIGRPGSRMITATAATTQLSVRGYNIIMDGFTMDGQDNGQGGTHSKNSYCIRNNAANNNNSNVTVNNIVSQNCNNDVFGFLNAAYSASGVYVTNSTFSGATITNVVVSNTNSSMEFYNNNIVGAGNGLNVNAAQGSPNIIFKYNNFVRNGVAVTGAYNSSVITLNKNIFCGNISDGYVGTNAYGCAGFPIYKDNTYSYATGNLLRMGGIQFGAVSGFLCDDLLAGTVLVSGGNLSMCISYNTGIQQILTTNSISSLGYITGYTETDPVFLASSGVFASIAGANLFTNTNTFNSVKIRNTVVFTGEYANGLKEAAFTIDWTLAQKQSIVLSGHSALAMRMTLTGSETTVGNYLLRIVKGTTGSIDRATSTTIKFPGGTKPTLSTGDGAIDIMSLYYDGTNRYGGVGLNYN